MKEKDFKEFSKKIILEGEEINKVEIFVNGEKLFEYKNIPIKDRIKTYEDACIELNLPLAPERCIEMTKDEAAYYSLKVITEALNEGWKPDWNNKKQHKWYPWFHITSGASAGLAFSLTNTPVSHANANIGSHLCFKTEELAEYAGKQFIELYEQFLL